jgi:hypothetical protein
MSRRRTAALVVVLLAGCTPSSITLRPLGEETIVTRKGGPAARVRVPEAGPGGVDLVVRSRGAFLKEDPDRVVIPVEVEVENRSESVVANFDPRAALLENADGWLSPAIPVASEATGGEVTGVPIEPGARRTFHIEFRARGKDDPRDVVPFTLHLDVAYGKTELSVAVHFVRELEYVPYYYRYGGYGPYWGPYYGSFYGNPYWGWGPYGGYW